MKLFIRKLVLDIHTDNGKYGSEIDFKKGLNVFWADNSMGKSTSVQAIMFALGLERMVSPTAVVPLPHVMTKYVEDSEGEWDVIESDVYLEIQNERQEIITIRRTAKGERDTKLVSVWESAELTSQTYERQVDYFLRDPGSATRDKGFHTYLSAFLGWDLPTVQRFAGGESKLYLETLFPLILVEQKQGWTGIQGNFPSYLGIKDAAKRAVEFLMELDILSHAAKLEKLKSEEMEIRAKWREEVEITGLHIEAAGGYLTGAEDQPTSSWPPLVPLTATFRSGTKRYQLSYRINELQDKINQLAATSVPSVGEAVPELSEKLNLNQVGLRSSESLFNELNRQIEGFSDSVESIEEKIEALEEDIRKHKDIRKIQEMGSAENLDGNGKDCPTCGHRLSDSLLSIFDDTPVMTVEDDIAFLESQMETFKAIQVEERAQLTGAKRELADLISVIREQRATIRSLKDSLTDSSASPSVANVRERLIAEQEIEKLEGVETRIGELTQSLQDLSNQWNKVKAARNKIERTGGFSDDDKRKLSHFEDLYLSQLKEYKVMSVQPTSINISTQTYKPERDGFNLGFDLSASDNIRSIWSYLIALLELDRNFETNHPGLLILDEPRQQEASKISFATLLRRVQNSGSFDQQVIFATSETLTDLKESLIGVEHNLIEVSGRVVKKIQN